MRPRIKKESGNDTERFKSKNSESRRDNRRDNFKNSGRDSHHNSGRNDNRRGNRNAYRKDGKDGDEFNDDRKGIRKSGFKSNRRDNDNEERRNFHRGSNRSGSMRDFKAGFKGGDHKERHFDKKQGKSYGGFAKSGKDFNSTVKRTVKKSAKNLSEEVTENKEIRLNKFIANSGICSRREADDYITAGLVTVNGKVITELGVKVLPTDDIRFNGERLRGEKKVYVLMNKPKDFVTTLSDPHAEKNVMQLISKDLCPERIFPVGRLDKSTTGVLLLTNDGELTEKLTHPSFQKKKIYEVTLDKNLKGSDMKKLVEGIELEDGIALADDASYVDDNKNVIGIEIHSGKNRIVRRMFESLGYRIKKLDRVYFAGLTKKNLRRGQWRFLSEEEVTRLKMNFYE